MVRLLCFLNYFMYNQLLNQIKLGFHQKFIYILVKYNKNLKNILLKLYEEGIIKRVNITKQYYKIFLNINIRFLFFKNFLKNRKKVTLTYVSLCKKQNQLSNFLLSNTFHQFKTHTELLKKHHGGKLFYKIL